MARMSVSGALMATFLPGVPQFVGSFTVRCSGLYGTRVDIRNLLGEGSCSGDAVPDDIVVGHV
jgi:hypothetical protein